MTPDDFRRIALSLEGAEEGSHMGSPDFRVCGRIFATLAAQAQGFGNLMLTPQKQAEFVAEAPEVFLPVPGGWGRNGATHLRLAAAHEDLVYGALQTAWKLRVEKNHTSGRKIPLSRPDKARTGAPGVSEKENIAEKADTSVARRSSRGKGLSRRLR